MARHKNDPEDFPPVVGFNKMFMDFQSILIEWKLNAKWHDGLNFSFLHSLKNESSHEVDQAAWRLHREAFSIIDLHPMRQLLQSGQPGVRRRCGLRSAERPRIETSVFAAGQGMAPRVER